MSKRRWAHTSERENSCRRSSLCLWVLALLLVLIISLGKLWGFLLYHFPEENYLCLLSLVIIVVHVIFSVKILGSYCLNDKNLTTRRHRTLKILTDQERTHSCGPIIRVPYVTPTVTIRICALVWLASNNFSRMKLNRMPMPRLRLSLTQHHQVLHLWCSKTHYHFKYWLQLHPWPHLLLQLPPRLHL